MHLDPSSSTHPLVSVCLRSSDWTDRLSEAMDSVLTQTYWNWEIVILNDRPSFEVKRTLVSYQRRYLDRIRVIEGARAGSRGCLASALLHCRGTFIATLDANDLMPQNRLRDQVLHIQSSSNRKAVTSLPDAKTGITRPPRDRSPESVCALGNTGNVVLAGQLASGRSMLLRHQCAVDLLLILAHEMPSLRKSA